MAMDVIDMFQPPNKWIFEFFLYIICYKQILKKIKAWK